MTTNQKFKKYTQDCQEKYQQTLKECEKLGRKAKLKSRLALRSLSHK